MLGFWSRAEEEGVAGSVVFAGDGLGLDGLGWMLGGSDADIWSDISVVGGWAVGGSFGLKGSSRGRWSGLCRGGDGSCLRGTIFEGLWRIG